MSTILVLQYFAKIKWTMLRYFYRDTPVPVLLQKVPAFLYRDTNVPSYGTDTSTMRCEVCFIELMYN